MAEKLTPQQEQVVNNRGGKLLVSAAAGSGKTKVLVDRLLSYVMDPMAPANLDDFLIITYTKAAAAELRGKIAAKLSERIAENPENRHLQQQMQRLYLAKISTVHSFCSDILREYAYHLDISADFRVADENECVLLRQRAMEQTLDKAYESMDADPDFRAFVDTQGLGRTDALVPEIVAKVYDSSRCHLDPKGFLDKCVQSVEAQNTEDAAQTLWGEYLMKDLFSYLDKQIAAMEKCATLAGAVEGWEKPAALLADTVIQLKELRKSQTWDQVNRLMHIDYGSLRISKKVGDQELAEQIKAVRESCKKGLAKKLLSFSDPSQVVLGDLRWAADSVRGLIRLVEQFSEAYSKLKRGRRVVDFGDLEHLTLDLFLGKSRTSPTAAAREVGERFREIMVDEDQDSNAVQDSIFSALTQKRQNLFMVGDVKQSIYQFRLADPGIFLEKYETYVHADTANPGEGRKILLSNNFRSSGGVIEAVNHVFRSTMSKAVGDLEYGAEEALYEGIPHCKLDGPEVELHALEVQENIYPEEAAYTAERICEMLDGKHMVRQGDALRPVRAEDIVILLRSPGSVGMEYQRALEARGIPCVTGGGTDLLQTKEICAVRSLLQVISNPRQDIPLAAVMLSPVFAWSADDLASIRKKYKKISLYECICADDTQASKAFLSTIKELRTKAKLYSITQLVEECFLLTKLDLAYTAMSDGQVRSTNLQTFYQICADYEQSGHKDLEQFLSYLDSMEDKGLISAADTSNSGAVTIMSIHKSKGLEFPVVFLCGLSREFNRESLRAQVLCDKDLGLGLSCIDTGMRLRYPSIAKRAITVKQMKESVSEELRVLYVAMTRARDRLIMVYSAKNLVKDLKDIALRSDHSGKELMTMEAICPGDWIMYAAMQRMESGALFALGGKPSQTNVSDSPWKIVTGQWVEVPVEEAEQTQNLQIIPEQTRQALEKALAFRYPHTAATTAPSKQTATGRKGRGKDEEASEDTVKKQVSARKWRRAAFSSGETGGKEYGNATHAVMQYIRYENCRDAASVAEEIRRLVEEGYISPEYGQMAEPEKISGFFATELGQKIRISADVIREFKFSILVDAGEEDPALLGEKILLQGVVDCALVETDGISIVDFKTDRVYDGEEEVVANRYRGQIDTYAKALERIFEKQVKAKYLYLFHINKLLKL